MPISVEEEFVGASVVGNGAGEISERLKFTEKNVSSLIEYIDATLPSYFAHVAPNSFDHRQWDDEYRNRSELSFNDYFVILDWLGVDSDLRLNVDTVNPSEFAHAEYFSQTEWLDSILDRVVGVDSLNATSIDSPEYLFPYDWMTDSEALNFKAFETNRSEVEPTFDWLPYGWDVETYQSVLADYVDRSEVFDSPLVFVYLDSDDYNVTQQPWHGSDLVDALRVGLTLVDPGSNPSNTVTICYDYEFALIETSDYDHEFPLHEC